MADKTDTPDTEVDDEVDTYVEGLVHELEGVEHRLEYLGKPDPKDPPGVKVARGRLEDRAAAIAAAIGKPADVTRARKRYGRRPAPTAARKPSGGKKATETRPADGGDVETR